MTKTRDERLPIPAGAATWDASVELSVVRFYDDRGQLIPLCKHGRKACAQCGRRAVNGSRSVVSVLRRASG